MIPKKLLEAFDRLFIARPMATVVAGSWKIVLAPELTQTMAVDGKHLFYNEEFVNKQSVTDLEWVLLHECFHILFGHHLFAATQAIKSIEKVIGRKLEPAEMKTIRNPLVQVASDLSINGLPEMIGSASQAILLVGLFPGIGPYDGVVGGKDAGHYLDKLLENYKPTPPPPPPPPQEPQGGGDGDGDDQEGSDSSDGDSGDDSDLGESESGEEKDGGGDDEDGGDHDSGEGKGEGEGKGDGEGKGEGAGEKRDGESGSDSGPATDAPIPQRVPSAADQLAAKIEQAGLGTPNMTGSVLPCPADTEDELRDAIEQWHQQATSAVQAEKERGTSPGWMKTFAESLSPISRVDWKTMLRRYLQEASRSQRTYSRPSRRAHFTEFLLPSRGGNGGGEIAILVDTSGSMSEAEMNKALSATSDILGQLPGEVRVAMYQCDTELIESATKRFTRNDFPMRVPHTWFGRGGTELDGAIAKVSHTRPRVLLIVTDMFFDYMKVKPVQIPTVWLTTSMKVDRVPFGSVVSMTK